MKIAALIGYHFQVDTRHLTPLEVASLWRQVQWVLAFENKRAKGQDCLI